MKEAKTLGPKGRYERLEKPIDQTFHLALMIRVATKPYWKKATKEQRKQLLTAFRRMSLSTLATLFDGYSGQVFKHIDEKDGPQKTRIVRTKIVNPDKSSHDIAYVAKKYQDRWYLVDVIVDNGISELSVRRSEYHRILSESGPDGLIRILNAKADELIPRE
ncbi:MAG: ABC transporter substrate-binding protein [Rhodospirillales bacterium]|nr:ABC transporter substrate-binding protein [Rhodospirillales bacterium]